MQNPRALQPCHPTTASMRSGTGSRFAPFGRIFVEDAICRHVTHRACAECAPTTSAWADWMCWSASSSTAACASSPSSRKRELSPTWPRRATPTAAAKTAVHQDRHSATHGAPLPLGRLCSATPQREMTSATTPSSLMYRPPRRLPDRMWIWGSTSARESAGRTATARQNQSILHFHNQGQSYPCKTPHAAADRLLQEDPRDRPDEPTRSLLRPRVWYESRRTPPPPRAIRAPPGTSTVADRCELRLTAFGPYGRLALDESAAAAFIAKAVALAPRYRIELLLGEPTS